MDSWAISPWDELNQRRRRAAIRRARAKSPVVRVWMKVTEVWMRVTEGSRRRRLERGLERAMENYYLRVLSTRRNHLRVTTEIFRISPD